MEMLDDRKLEVTLVMFEAHMGRQLKDNGLEYELYQRVLQAVADLGREVVHIPPLGWDGHAVGVQCSLPCVEVENLLQRLECTREQKKGTNHESCSSFSGLAVKGHHVVLVLPQPGLHVLAEGENLAELGQGLDSILSDG